jgi:anti-sigma factor RsiW
MKCDEVRETLPDLAAGFTEPSAAMTEHLQACAPCTAQLQEFRQTMALMDEWEAPDPSPYFDTRLQARLREEKALEAARGRGWLAWWPRPALAMAAALAVAAGIGIWQHGASGTTSGTTTGTAGNIAIVAPAIVPTSASAERGTAVGDLQTLDSDNDLYADFDVLDDIDSQQNSATATATN